MKIPVYVKVVGPRGRSHLSRCHKSSGADRGWRHECLAIDLISTSSRLPWLLDVRKSTEQEDLLGIDVIVQHIDGREIPLQVKSSAKEAQLFRKRRRERGDPPIPVVVLDSSKYSVVQNRERVERALTAFLEQGESP